MKQNFQIGGRSIIDNINTHIGEIRKNNKGTSMKIIAYRKGTDIDVEFLDNHHYVFKHAMYTNFTKGQIKNPYDKTIYNIGCIGVGNHKIWDNDIKRNSPVYDIWSAMIERCYVNKKKYPAYHGIVTICDEWLVFQNFAKWYDENKYQCDGRLHVDKDILYPGNKVYSPENCILIPQRINELFSVCSRGKSNLPQGIKKWKTGYSASYCGKSLGMYKTLKEACEVYIKRKEQAIREVANEYKGIIPETVYNALINYKIDVERFMEKHY